MGVQLDVQLTITSGLRTIHKKVFSSGRRLQVAERWVEQVCCIAGVGWRIRNLRQIAVGGVSGLETSASSCGFKKGLVVPHVMTYGDVRLKVLLS